MSFIDVLLNDLIGRRIMHPTKAEFCGRSERVKIHYSRDAAMENKQIRIESLEHGTSIMFHPELIEWVRDALLEVRYMHDWHVERAKKVEQAAKAKAEEQAEKEAEEGETCPTCPTCGGPEPCTCELEGEN